MRLTREEHPEAIKRYAALEAAPPWSARCGAVFEGAPRRCSRRPGHRGPHAARGRFGTLHAVWDAETTLHDTRSGRPARRPPGLRGGDESAIVGFFTGLLERASRNPMQILEEGLLLLFAIAMVGFVIDWLIRMVS